ncbi:nucleotide sugar dehydrogenase [Paenibacillus sp. HB172176]|uniref:nucleotide sugar dehydrogenase n=1 Tax=Paenibacillus sp. HB172176 TaxID=2493690 RepID=UPI00143A3585|nr:nucleotide sugar dehydrogenase [Paenibacillus sp. HB172176]
MNKNIPLLEQLKGGHERIAIIGLGYVGLPIAVSLSKKMNVIGFDIDIRKIESYRSGIDVTGDLGAGAIAASNVLFTSDESELDHVQCFIVAVPTPVQSGNVPNLKYLKNASRLIGRKLKRGAVVIYESTVYPGVTEDICIPILESQSGLSAGFDFKVGYSPERINPGDREHRLESVVKIVSGIDEEALEMIASLYELIVTPGVYRAESIKVAEAAKVIENAQRDINIAFMNELSMIFNHMNIDTRQVLDAAQTKWNFLPFTPGLVGGHCIGIDPYYLTFKAEDAGFPSRLILSGRQINDGMSTYVVQQLMKLAVRLQLDMKSIRIGILGVTYKENCPDTRNSKIIDMIDELKDYGISPIVTDPEADKWQLRDEHGIELTPLSEINSLDIIVAAVPHRVFVEMNAQQFKSLCRDNANKLMIDIRGVLPKRDFENMGFHYWSL